MQRSGDLSGAELDQARSNARAQPQSAAAWIKLGQAFIAAGRTSSAPQCFRRATELEPRTAAHWARLGKVLLSLRQYQTAEDALRQACDIDSGSAQFQMLLGAVLIEQNDIEGALGAYARGLQSEPGNLQCEVARALLLPPIYRDAEAVDFWRSRFDSGLSHLRADAQTRSGWPTQALGLQWHNFSLAHQGGDDRALQERYADFIATLLARVVPNLQESPPRAPALDRKIRVGFLSAALRVSTIGAYFSSWIFDLPKDRFEVRSYFTGYLPDTLTAKIAEASDSFQTLGGTVESIAQRVRSDRLDILIFPDVGMSTESYLLANLRLAPIQCAAWGHPVTTGSRFIDHFLSCAEMEPDGGASHYRENLILLPGLGVRYKRPPPGKVLARERIAIADDAHMYVCPNRLHKNLPERDRVLLEILARDAKAILVFFDTVAPGQRRAFIARLELGMRACGIEPRQQLKFLPELPHGTFRDVLAIADVMLDSPNFSGGSSALDALAVGLPIIAQEGRYMRGRQSAAMLRIVGLPELVASDDERYVELAVHAASDRAYRASLSERIMAGLPRLFDRHEPIEALGTVLIELAERGAVHNNER
jgi:CRISPR-associated protein Csy1